MEVFKKYFIANSITNQGENPTNAAIKAGQAHAFERQLLRFQRLFLIWQKGGISLKDLYD
jgi:hypothetical protein